MLVDEIFKSSKRIAVVGLSDKPERYSFKVASYLIKQGYRIVPVNPNVSEVLGEKSYPDLISIPFQVDVVQIFRKNKFVPEIVEQAIEIGAKAVWMQEGISHEEAAKKAREAGIKVMMDMCMMKEHRKLSE